MINIKKENDIAFNIKFDKSGSEELIKTLKNTIHMKRGLIEVKKKKDGSTINLEFIQDDNINKITFSKDRVVIRIDKDEIEYFIERLIESINSKCFYPSEVCECSNKRKSLTIYAKFIDSRE